MIIDRFEGNFAIIELEDRSFIDIPLIYIPKEAKEGDSLKIVLDVNTSRERKEKINNLMDDLWE